MTKFVTAVLYNEIKETWPKNRLLSPHDYTHPLRKRWFKKPTKLFKQRTSP